VSLVKKASDYACSSTVNFVQRERKVKITLIENLIDKIIENGRGYLYFYRKTKNYSNFTFLREYELVVNSALRIFGTDNNGNGTFNWDIEKPLISSDEWYGRFWNFDDFTLKIENNKGTRELSMLMTFVDESTTHNKTSYEKP
jgi:hypothetical protein